MFFMFSKIIWFVKKVIFGILFLYALNVMLPINVFNVFLTAFLGFPFILMFCLFSLFIF